MLTAIIIIIVVIVAIPIVKILSTAYSGASSMQRLRRGQFRNEQERLIVSWLNEKPSRLEQSELYILIVTRIGLSEASAYSDMISAAAHAVTGKTTFGKLLCEKLDKRTEFGPPSLGATEGDVDTGHLAFQTLKTKLLELDN